MSSPLKAGVLLALLLSAACGTAYRAHRPPKGLLPSLQNIPESETFESYLGQPGRLIEALFAIDELVEPESDTVSARDAYQALLEKARPLVEKAQASGDAHAAALEVLGVLRGAGFAYDDEVLELSPQFGSVSRSLVSRRGICLSFTMLTMAFLDSCGIGSRAACYPRHILVRVRKDDREIELESTVFGDPVVHRYPEDLEERARKEGFIYARSLDPSSAAWVYLTERLWGWVLKRSKDPHSFLLLERAEEILKGSDESIAFQWALRHHQRSTNAGCSPAERRESFQSAVEEFEQLLRWNARSAISYLHLSTLYEQTGRRKPALETLQRFVEAVPDPVSTWEVFVTAWWWTKRQEFDLEGFRLSVLERKQCGEFLDRHYPFADRAQRFRHFYGRLFQANPR